MLAETPCVLSSRHPIYGAINKAITGDEFCHCELHAAGLFFRTRRGELLTPLSEVSALWHSGSRWSLGNPVVCEVQVRNKKLPEWRFVFILSSVHGFASKTVPNLARAILKANPEASIIPTPDEFPLLARLHAYFFR